MESKQHYQWHALTMGTCYYPEQWAPSLWESDLSRMREAGISTIRIGEFAWSILEPEEGTFSFSFFDAFLDLCARHGMQVIFGTPTATPPAWLTQKYPDVLNGTRDGALFADGGRRQYNYNSETYQALCSRIVEQLARHYGHHPMIVGWQIDNELNCEKCEFFSQADSEAFRRFLQKKYGTLQQLNDALGTVFWNQTYTSWEQLRVPGLNACSAPDASQYVENPGLHLDYYRFISESANRFCRMQADILRRYLAPGVFITTNGIFPNIDYRKMQQESLDVLTYDSYPSFAFGLARGDKKRDDLYDRYWSHHLTEVRALCPHFGIMEQQAGANGWNTHMEGPAPRPGQLTLWAMQSVAHGADYISFFRWRTCTRGTEIYWHGILDYDNRDNRKLREVKSFYQKLQAIAPVCGSDFTASFALLKDYDNTWDAELDVWHQRVAGQSEQEIFAGAQLAHLPYDILYLQQDTTLAELQKYPLLVYPHPVIACESRVRLLEAYVQGGGILLLGCRSGYKDLSGACVMQPQPGLFGALTGTDVQDFTFTSPVEAPSQADWDGHRLDTPLFNDILTPLPGTKTLARYCTSYYAGAAALTEHNFGAGKVLHFGSVFTRSVFQTILTHLGIQSPFADVLEAPAGCELVLRRKEERAYIFVLNYLPEPAVLTAKMRLHELYTNQDVQGKCTLAGYGTAVYEVSAAADCVGDR